jgi:hypothetical protein
VVAHHTDVELAAVDELFDDGRREDGVVDVLDSLVQLLFVGDDRRLRDAD